jgi:phosphatidylglycerol---prolipoprotein diacylglyceryl transferase
VHPVIFEIPILGLPLHTYGLMIVTGFMLGMFVVSRQGQRHGGYHEEVMDFGFWALIGGMIGARVVFIMVNAREYFIEKPFVEVPQLGFKIPAVFAIWQGGLVFYGAALGGFIAFIIYAKKHKLPMLKMADILIPALPLGHAFGRLGCVAAGCCWGDPFYHMEHGAVISDIPLAMRFPEGSLAYGSLLRTETVDVVSHMKEVGHTLPLFPSQLVESFGVLAIFFFLTWVHSRKWFHGQVLLTFAIAYPVLRSILEIFRGDAGRGYVIDGVLSTSQFISIFVALASLVTLFILRQKQKNKAALS